MTDASDLPISSNLPQQQAVAFAGPAALLAGERAAGYDDLLARVTETLKPADVLEHIWVRDVVDLSWEVFRLRRIKVELMAAAAWEGMAKVLEPFVDHTEEAGKAWFRGDSDITQKAQAALARAGQSMDAVAARTFSARIGDFERISRMTTAAEARRNAALHELDIHRASFALRLRHALHAVEEIELRVIAPAGPVPRADAVSGL